MFNYITKRNGERETVAILRKREFHKQFDEVIDFLSKLNRTLF